MKVSARERRLLILLAMVAVVAGLRALWFAAQPEGYGGPGGGGRGTRGGRGRVHAAGPREVERLRTDLLEPHPTDFEVGRDVFHFGPPPPPPPPPPPTAAELEARRRAEEEARRRAAEAALEAAKPKPPPLTLRYLGSFGPDDAKIAVFTDAGGDNIWNARQGEVVDGKFIVDRIGFESVDIRFVGFESVAPARLAVAE